MTASMNTPMKFVASILLLVLSARGVCRADAPAPATAAVESKPAWQPSAGDRSPRPAPVERKIGIGLLIGAGVAAALAITFVGLAKGANDDALRNNVYDPGAVDRRNAFQETHTVLFTVGAAALASGLILTFVR
jgi:hypothetical protein